MYNLTIIGAGKIAQVHAANIALNPNVTLYSVVSRTKESAQRLADKYHAKVQSIDDVMNDASVNGVVICSLTETHADLIELAAKANKAIFCEKPIALDMERTKQCLDVVQRYNASLLIGFNRRFDPNFSGVKNAFTDGSIGKAETLVITSRDPLPPPVEYVKGSGGLFKDMTIHDFDMARFILGEEPVSIYAQGSNLVDPQIGDAGDIDTALITIKFESGALAVISNSRRSGYGYDQRIELHGERGVLTVKNLLENTVEMWNGNGCIYAKPEDFYLERYNPAYQAEINHFAKMIAKEESSACDEFDGEMALRMAEAAYESLISQKEVLFKK